MTRKRRRLLALALGLGLLGAATAMVLAAFNDNLVFYGPSDLAAKAIPRGAASASAGSSNSTASCARPTATASVFA